MQSGVFSVRTPVFVQSPCWYILDSNLIYNLLGTCRTTHHQALSSRLRENPEKSERLGNYERRIVLSMFVG